MLLHSSGSTLYVDRVVGLGVRRGSLVASSRLSCRWELGVEFPCLVSGVVWFVVALRLLKVGVASGVDVVVVVVRSTG